MEEKMKNPFRFSSPKSEELFKHLTEAAEGNNLMAKKLLVELIENQTIRIVMELEEREKQICQHQEAIAELESAKNALTIEQHIAAPKAYAAHD